jgi:hypothetical protein
MSVIRVFVYTSKDLGGITETGDTAKDLGGITETGRI